MWTYSLFSCNFQLVARNNGPEALATLLELLLPLSKDKDQWKQRCVANVIGGIIYGMKLWSPEKISKFWATLQPVVSDCLNNVTQETYEYWLSAISLSLVSLQVKLISIKTF